MNRRELLIAAAAAPAALALPRTPRAVAGGGTQIALVTADSENRVLAVSLDRVARVVRSLAVPDQPHGIEAVDWLDAALVLSEKSGTVTVLDASGPRVRRVIEGFQGPRYAAGDPRGRFAYVSDDVAGQVIAIDVRRARVAGRVEVGKGARHISISPDGTRVVTALGTKAPRLALVDVSRPLRPRLLRTFPADDLAHDVGFTPDGEQLWISSGVDRRLALHDARTLRFLRAIPGDAPPQHVTFDGSYKRAYVASGDSGTLRTYRLADTRLLSTRRVPLGSYNVCAQAGHVITPSLSRGTLTVGDHRGLHSTRLAPDAHDACIVIAS